MNVVECLGYFASMLVLTTFCMRGMIELRVLALASNAAFIAYAALADIEPVLLLHMLLVPMNAWRLLEIMLRRRRGREENGASRPMDACRSPPAR